MTCAEIRNLLSEFIDGEGSRETSEAVRAHVASCAACTAELESLNELREATALLAREIEPEGDLWSGIEADLESLPEDAAQRRARVFGALLRMPRWSPTGFAWRFALAAVAAWIVVVGVREWRSRGSVEAAAWDVTTIEGSPVVGSHNVATKGSLRSGEWLETNAASRARIDVANIGQVTVGPASAIRLLGSSDKEHRIELARGEVNAFIWAPPRLFFVETPSGVAEDLGCQYHLVVDEQGNGSLEVTLGFVSFERDTREVIVPAGARCDLRAGVGPGTPYDVDATAELRDALASADFANHPGAAVDTVLAAATEDDAVTLWHLIPRTDGAERERVVDRLASWVPLPDGTTRDGVVALDKRMLELWWEELYPSWSNWN
jgi:predicted anti-sigma-YlaC factor YlaD